MITAKSIMAYAPDNYTGAAATGAWVSLKNNRKLLITLITGSWAGGTAAVTLSQAKDVSGTSAKTLAFTKMYTNKAAPTSAAMVETAVTSNTFNLDTANSTWIIEIDVADLDTTNGFDCVRVNVGSPGANNDYHAGIYTFERSAYMEDVTLNQRAN